MSSINFRSVCRLAWLAILLLLLAGCRPERDVVVITVPPTRAVATLAAPHTGEQLSATIVATVVPLPTPTVPGEALATAAATASPTAAPETLPPSDSFANTTYQVIYVTDDDRLNVRNGPGTNNQVLGSLAPDARGIRVTADGQMVRGDLWLPIERDSVNGWVNSLFLTEEIPPTEFCTATPPGELVARLRAAITSSDGAQFAELVHPERGLRIRQSWWNPEVWLSKAEVAEAFTTVAVHDWGTADGSGLPLRGSLRDVILPLLEADLAGAGETACNELLHGGTAGIVQLPAEYAPANFYSVYRPAPNDEFDWGSWAIGMERWNGRYYITYLVHYAWEI